MITFTVSYELKEQYKIVSTGYETFYYHVVTCHDIRPYFVRPDVIM